MRILITFYLTNNDHRLVIFISLKTIKSSRAWVGVRPLLGALERMLQNYSVRTAELTDSTDAIGRAAVGKD